MCLSRLFAPQEKTLQCPHDLQQANSFHSLRQHSAPLRMLHALMTLALCHVGLMLLNSKTVRRLICMLFAVLLKQLTPRKKSLILSHQSIHADQSCHGKGLYGLCMYL